MRDNHIELQEGVTLPNGTEVDVTVPDTQQAGLPAALLALLDSAPLCGEDDVDALTSAINDGRRAARFQGLFDTHSAA